VSVATSSSADLPRIRRARPAEAADLRELAHRSKAHWPYSAAFLEAVRPLLVLEPVDVRRDEVHVLETAGTRIGWYRVRFDGDRAELEDLWVEPAFIGLGHGRSLFEHAVMVARRGGANRLEWDAEPFAEGFYTAMGGHEFTRSPSAVVPGRTLPRMRLRLVARAAARSPGQGTRNR
jgi:GNAT superfamily N-acetyltransferase